MILKHFRTCKLGYFKFKIVVCAMVSLTAIAYFLLVWCKKNLK